ncbi:MAG: hypothetical protein U1E56_03285 [Bauldia sp.]
MKFAVWTGLAVAGCVGIAPALAADAGRYYPPAASRAPAVYGPGPLITGNIELYFGTEDPTSGGAGSIVGGAGRVNMPLTMDWSLQLDAYGSSSSSSLSASQAGVTAHFYRRDPNAYAIGFFVGYTSTNTVGTTSGPLIGAEGQIYNGPLTLGADVSVANLSNGVDTVVNLHGQARFYLMPNFKLQADAAHASVSGGNDVTSLGVSAEYRFTNTPFSLFGAGRWDHATGLNVTTGVIGGRLFFDPPGATLQSHERSGAGWLVSPGLRF